MSTGTPLLCVAIHEIGHSLGVRHSDDEGAIMWPWAGECTEDTSLGQDDIDAIQHLYGELLSLYLYNTFMFSSYQAVLWSSV